MARELILTLPETDTQNARNLGDTKETVSSLKVVAFDGKEWYEPIDVRFYMSRTADGAGPVYCSLWLNSHDRKRFLSGHGRASGYGYCKRSGAFEVALRSAGVDVSYSIHGAGMSVVRECIQKLAESLGWGGMPFHIVEAG